ncbi:1405_t:CDS:2 [Funneliformis geosporum]|uniref:2570_t:CDS:1 n=1 Tax=Funneliformis geosporum TaxID=1117311 RepID=A0A9W4WWV0_9GLOM|nr:1405_t:CDS:2 [Funneliformis geosporum]CAI2178171.1 2570_t:CDS:2 [Funneliformis geosporum]
MSWKGTSRALGRLPQHIRAKTGLGTSTQDTDYDDILNRFVELHNKTEQMYKDAVKFRDGISFILNHQANFSDIMVELYNPIVGKNEAESTTRRITTPVQSMNSIKEFQMTMVELRDIILPELDHVDNMVVSPSKDFMDIIKMIKKTIIKREHKKVDFDRYTTSVRKLQEKKDRSLSEGKSLVKAQENLSKATGEYEYYNELLKKELPAFFEYRAQFIELIITNFYNLQLKIYGILHEKMELLINKTGYFDVRSDILENYNERTVEVNQQMEQLTLLHRFDKKGLKKENSDTSDGTGYSSKNSAYKSKNNDSEDDADAPPPYSSIATPPVKMPTGPSSAARSPSNPKLYPIYNAPPSLPPHGSKPITVQYVRALYDYDAQAGSDLSFKKGDKIEVINRTANVNDWWKGKLNNVIGDFPGNYVEDW